MSLARLDALYQALRNLPAALEDATADVVRDNAHVLEDANAEQLSQGLDANGQDIRPEYAPLTVEIKTQKGQPTDRVTLRDEGDFYAGIVADVRGTIEFEMVGTDPKTDKLEEIYGPVVGLTEKSLGEFREDYVRPELQAKTRDLLGI